MQLRWSGLKLCPYQGPFADLRLATALQVLKTQLAAKKEGYADVVYLDAKTDTFLEEVSSCNIFTVQGKTIRTPPIEVRSANVSPIPVHTSSHPALRSILLSLSRTRLHAVMCRALVCESEGTL